MNWLKRLFQQGPDPFQQLLEQQGQYAVASAQALQDYLKKPGTKRSVQARQTEKEADEIQRMLIHKLEDTFVTPLDREDIFALAQAVDNFIDYVYDTVAELEIFELEPSAQMLAISALLKEMADELYLGLKQIIDYPRVANQHARRIKHIENQVETAYRKSLADMFSGPEDIAHVMQMLKAREVLRHMSNASDQGDRAADIILDIGIKWY